MRFGPLILLLARDHEHASSVRDALRKRLPDAEIALEHGPARAPQAALILLEPDQHDAVASVLRDSSGAPPTLVALLGRDETVPRDGSVYDDVIWRDEAPAAAARRLATRAMQATPGRGAAAPGLGLAVAQKLETLGVAVGGIAHDFNNLLMTILANAKLARMDLPDGSPALESVEQLEVAARRAAELTRQMLAYAGRARIDVSRVSPSKLVTEMGPLLSTVIAKRAELELELDETLQEIDADEGQVRQLLLNLVTNASDALEGRAGSIRVRTGGISYTSGPPEAAFVSDDAPAGEYIFIEVEDTGCGVPEPNLPRIFDPFFTTKVASRGLGLAAVLGIVRAHHGAIQVASRHGEGSRVRILLPLASAKAVEDRRTIPLVSDQPGVTVLVADDEEQLRTTLERLLVQFDFRVLTAADGVEAVEAVRTHATELDVVLLDLTMPELGGAEALEAIREIDPTLPVMFMSGYHGHAEEAVGENDPLTAFVHKPFDPLALIHRLGEMARRRERPGAAATE